MRYNHFIIFFLIALCCTACQADTITVTYNEDKQPVVSPLELEGLKISINNGTVKIKDGRTEPTELTFVLKGKSNDGSFKLNTDAKTRILLDGLTLTSKAGAPLHLKNKKRVEIVAADGTENTLTITACTDTATQKAAVIWAKDKLRLSGNGTLNVIAQGDGCKGINGKDNIIIEDLTLNIQTLGDNLGVDTTHTMGFGGPPPGFDPDNIPEEMKAQFEEMRKRFEEMMKNGEFPMMGGGNRPNFPMGGQGQPDGGFQPGGDRPEGDNPMGGGGFGGKQKFLSTCKGIKAKETITINSGKVSVTTNSRGAEGIEGKQGVIINGGEVYVHAVDDAINSGGQIIFNGGRTCVISTTNDAVDSNAGGFGFGGGMPPFMNQASQNEETSSPFGKQETQDPAIVINGGEVLAWSQTGPPEEGLDCDFAPIQISGGTVFSIGAGMGEMPSVPTAETAKQPTVLLIGLNIEKDQPVAIYETDKKGKATGKPIATYTVPFAFQSSSSLISNPAFQTGKTYVVKSTENTYSLKLAEPFTVSRQGKQSTFSFPWEKQDK
ncbi:MAG: carbohydrate-binding domain-containing protein [Bacteroidaceae bacterium]|nr:carbohydrate-binding domain-containing protein [Bacteroidaceae bacterium]